MTPAEKIMREALEKLRDFGRQMPCNPYIDGIEICDSCFIREATDDALKRADEAMADQGSGTTQMGEILQGRLEEITRNRGEQIEKFLASFVAVKLPEKASLEVAKAIFDSYCLVEKQVQLGHVYTHVFTIEPKEKYFSEVSDKPVAEVYKIAED